MATAIRDPSRRRLVFSLATGCAAALVSRPGRAEDGFPSRPVHIVVVFAPGGPTDLMARSLARAMADSLGQPVIVDNRPGGGGVIGMSEITRQPADGYAMVLPSILAVTNPALMPNYPFDTLRDFSPLTVVGFVPHVVVVRPDFAAQTLPALVALAKSRPDGLSYGSTGIGTSAHLGAALFARRSGIEVVHIPYRGAGPAVEDLLGGRFQFMFLDMTTALPLVRSGRLPALAMAPGQRFAGLPDVPTIAELGYPGFDVHTWYGLLLKSGTPASVEERLYSEVKRALDSAEVRKVFDASGIEPGGMPPEAFKALVRSDLKSWKETIEQLHITL